MTPITWSVIALLIAFNGLYVAAEFSVVTVRRSRIRQRASQGNRWARSLLPVLEDPQRLDRYIAACQVGITVSSLVLGAYGQATLGQSLAPLFERWGDLQTAAAQSTAAVTALVGLTALQMVMGELVPKSLALQHPTRLALATALPMRWSETLLTWFVALLNGSGWLVLRMLGVKPKPHRHLHSADEIKYLVAESREGGYLGPREQRRLNEALGLTRRTARELMVPRTRVVAIDAESGVDAAVEAASDSPFTRFPVYEESIDRIVGFVHAKDVAAAWIGANGDPPGLEPHVRPILAVHETLTADRVLALMRRERGVMAVVVDDFGGTSGIITTEDILSEILGDVADEFKLGGTAPRPLADGRIRLAGHTPLYEAIEWLGTKPQGGASTLGGMITAHLGHIPRDGETLEIDGVEMEVEEMDGQAVTTVLVRPPVGEEEAPEEGDADRDGGR